MLGWQLNCHPNISGRISESVREDRTDLEIRPASQPFKADEIRRPEDRVDQSAAAGPIGPIVPAAVSARAQHHGASLRPPQEDGSIARSASRDSRSAALSRRTPAEPGRAGPGEMRRLFSLRHRLSGPLHRHPGCRKSLARPRKIPAVLHNRRVARVSSAECAKRLARSTPSS